MNRRVLLEPAAETVCIENSVPPLIFELPPEEGRRVLEKAQDAPVYMYPAQVEASMVETGHWGSIPVYRVTPINSEFAENVIFYIHGESWPPGPAVRSFFRNTPGLPRRVTRLPLSSATAYSASCPSCLNRWEEG